MKTNLRKNILLILFLCIISESILAQNEIDLNPKNQIEFQHDNDIIGLTDRYYTSGLFLTYRRRLIKGIFPSLTEQLSFQFQVMAYTPDDLDAVDVNKIDRPYAGFSGLKMGWSFAKKDWLIESKFLIGLTGPSSGAGQFHRWFHSEVINFSIAPWIAEIEDSFHTNLELILVKEWQLSPNPFSVYLALTPALAYGTKDVYIEPKIIFYFGRRNPLNSSIAYDQIGSVENETFFTMRLAYRYVSHNALLQGNRSGDNSPFTIEPNEKLVDFGFDLRHRSKKNYYKFGYHSLSSEAAELHKHKYLSISYGRSF
ncbi:MAG: hypothetical protein DRI70_03555 [Bacteroidetes bacterium]|nr:MAG: hypothetical protein DRI70_03555 [Bacteroidota bacterium]